MSYYVIVSTNYFQKGYPQTATIRKNLTVLFLIDEFPPLKFQAPTTKQIFKLACRMTKSTKATTKRRLRLEKWKIYNGSTMPKILITFV